MKLLFWKKEPESLGKIGENLAAKFLKKNGYKILGRNFKNPQGRRLGEIDIIAEKDDKIIFCEVKTRWDNDPLPEESITRKKLYRLKKIAGYYLNNNSLGDKDYQFDAIAILMKDNEKNAEIKHLESIFY